MNKGRMPSLACGPFLLALLLAACSDDSVPSSKDNDQLNNAAEMLDNAADDLEGIDQNALAPPAANSQ